jgi:hypothetical protein
MAKVTKKADPKKIAKATFSEKIAAFLASEGYTVANGVDFGFTEGTLVINAGKTDVQIKFITPKAGLEHYEPVVDENEVELIETAEPVEPDAGVNAEYLDHEVTV